MWLVKTHTELNEHYERRVKNNIVRITEQCYLLFHLCHEVAMTSLSPWTLRKTIKKTKTKNKTDLTSNRSRSVSTDIQTPRQREVN